MKEGWETHQTILLEVEEEDAAAAVDEALTLDVAVVVAGVAARTTGALVGVKTLAAGNLGLGT